MFQFNYKLKVSERVKAKCNRHSRYNPERDGPTSGEAIAGRRSQGVSKKSIALDTSSTIPY
jgi:hypothetical protein